MTQAFAAGAYDACPLALVGLLLVTVFALVFEIGFRVERRIERRRRGDDGAEETQVLATALLLLALLLGFTFSMALDRFEERRGLAVAEANAINAAWHRAGLIATPAAQALQHELVTYARSRIGGTDTDLEDRRQAGAALRHRIWTLTDTVTLPIRDTQPADWLITAVGAVMDLGITREAAIDARLPERLVTALMVFSVVTMFLLGYVFGALGQRNLVASGVLFALLALTIVLIIDLDRPIGGAISVSQRAMIDLVKTLSNADIGAGAAGRSAVP